MRNPQIANIASIALLGLLSSQAFAWSIDGVVKSKISGRLLGGVKISTFNFGGYETTSAEDGTFRLSGDGTTAIASTKASNVALHMEGNMLTIYNADARSLSVSVITRRTTSKTSRESSPSTWASLQKARSSSASVQTTVTAPLW